MPTEPEGRVELGRIALAELPPGKKRRLARPPYDILIVNVAGTVHAIEDACPHSGVSLCDGDMRGHRITCAGHAWIIDVRDGHVVEPSGMDDVCPVFDVVIEGAFAVVYAR